MFDWANSAFATLVVTFVYATYFTTAIAADEVTGTAQWSRAVGLSGILVAVLAPPLGALADRSGRRLTCLGVCTLVCCIASAGMTGVHPDLAWAGLIALSLFVIANVGFELSTVFYNAFLPELAPAERVGRLSGWAWGLGYAGGLLSLVLALAVLAREQPLFGISTEAGFNYRAVCLLAAGWFALFSLPLFMFAPRQPSRSGSASPRTGAYDELRRTFGRLRHYPDIARLLAARLLYNDGLVTIFAFGGIYAAGTFGMSLPEVIRFGIALNVTAGIGAGVFGFVDDRLGGKRTILVTLIALTACSLLAVWAPSVGWLWLAGLSPGAVRGTESVGQPHADGPLHTRAAHCQLFRFIRLFRQDYHLRRAPAAGHSNPGDGQSTPGRGNGGRFFCPWRLAATDGGRAAQHQNGSADGTTR